MVTHHEARKTEPSFLAHLLEIVQDSVDLDSSLDQIARLGKKAMGSAVCSITMLAPDQLSFTAVASAGMPPDSNDVVRKRRFLLGSGPNAEFDFKLITSGEVIERYNLGHSGQGVAKTEACRRHGINSLLAVPLKSGNRLLGYFNHFSDQRESFSHAQRERLHMFADCTVLALERLESHYLGIDALSAISEWLLTPAGDIGKLCDQAARLMRVSVGIIWKMDQEKNILRVLANSSEVDSSFRILELDPARNEELWRFIHERRIGYLPDVLSSHRPYEHRAEAIRHRWVSLLSQPLYAGARLVGMFDIYDGQKRSFDPWERRIFDFLGNQLGLYIERTTLSQSLQEALDVENHFDSGLQKVTANSAEIARADYCVLRLLVDERPYLETRAHEVRLGYASECGWELPVAKGEGIAGHVWDSGAFINCSDRAHLGYDPVDPGISLLCLPIKSEQHAVLGTITLGADRPDAFSVHTRQLLEKVLEDLPPEILKSFSHDKLERVTVLAMESASLDTFLKGLAGIVRTLMRAEVAIVWRLDKRRNGFTPAVVAHADYQQPENIESFLPRSTVADFLDVTEWALSPFVHNLANSAVRLALPLHNGGQPQTILEVGLSAPRLEPWRKKMLQKLGEHASTAIRNLAQKTASGRLIQALAKIGEAQSKQEVTRVTLSAALDLAGSENGCISILNHQNGLLELAHHEGEAEAYRAIEADRGVTGRALHHLRPIRLGDVAGYKPFCPFWSDMVSELAVPIFLPSATVRDEVRLDRQPRPIGVLNVECPTPDAYDEYDESCLMTLASHAAIALDRMEYDENLTALNRAEFDLAQMVAHHEEWDLLLEKVFQEITTTLHYSHVNLSLVHNNRIKTESVGGPWLTPAEKEQFKSLADHPIAPEATADEDIQSYVVRTQHIVVPRKKPPRHDKRFDPKIHFRFRYDQLVLVYIPMVLGGEVLGTVEAGYPRRYKKHIYERDIQILKGFVDYVSVAIAQRRRELLEKLSHEFNDAIRGVRSNAVFLRAKWKGMDEEKISRKFGDILSDCDVLNLQVRRLEFYLGGAYPQPRLEMTSIGPNVLVKTINQLEPELKRRGFRSADIDLNYDQFADVRALVDHAQLCEVMNNLFSNAIKYADPEEPFRMKILINERHDYCVLKIQDWGIGIKPEYEEKIFADGFRTPEAIAMAHGTGFGLWLSRLMMRHMGGDLRLSHHRKPTEFEIHLLKRAGTRKKQ